MSEKLTREESEVILRELREGTPDTPERIAMFKRADELHARIETQRIAKLIRAYLDEHTYIDLGAHDQPGDEGQLDKLASFLALGGGPSA